MTAFAAGLLRGRRIALSGASDPQGATIDERLAALGAEVHALGDDERADEDAAARWASQRAPLHALVHCASASDFGAGGAEGLQGTLAQAWLAVRAVATGAMIESGVPGKLVLVAPALGAEPFRPLAAAAADGLENLARTLSVEWARFSLTAVAIVPRAATTDADMAELVCYLVSPAGAYLSGCRLDLGLNPPAGPAVRVPPATR